MLDFEEWVSAKGFEPESLSDKQAASLRESWRAEQLHDLRASRAKAPAPLGESNAAPAVAAVLEAGLAHQMGVPLSAIAMAHGERVADAATRPGYRSVGIHDICRAVLAAHGKHVPPGKLGHDSIREALELAPRASGISTISVPGILSNAANKAMLMGFSAVGMTWGSFCRTSSVNDFKQRKSYRMTTTGAFEEIPPGGKIQHVEVEEAEQTAQAKTRGAMLGLDRTDLINDDIGAFASLPGSLGRLSAIAIEKAVYTLMLANTGNFFHADNDNLLTGAGSVLSLSGLDPAVEAFREQVDANGDPTMTPIAVLLTPSKLEGTARSLMNSGTVIDGTATDEAPGGNRWAGLAMPVSSAYLGVALGLTGGSDTAWYLLAGPGDFAIIDVCGLNGRLEPFVETAEADFNQLGIQMRAYSDFGVSFLEHRGCVKSAGA
jgi:hypothetical protein